MNDLITKAIYTDQQVARYVKMDYTVLMELQSSRFRRTANEIWVWNSCHKYVESCRK